VHHPAHSIGRSVHFTEIPDFTATFAIGDCDGVSRLCHVDPDENI
jgi:hypothetical protein